MLLACSFCYHKARFHVISHINIKSNLLIWHGNESVKFWCMYPCRVTLWIFTNSNCSAQREVVHNRSLNLQLTEICTYVSPMYGSISSSLTSANLQHCLHMYSTCFGNVCSFLFCSRAIYGDCGISNKLIFPWSLIAHDHHVWTNYQWCAIS